MPPRDPGKANERTALAWQRTALSLVAGAAIAARLGMADTGPVLLMVLGVAATLGLWIFAESSRRYRHSTGTAARAGGRGGRAAFMLAVATTLIAGGELLVVSA